MPRLQHAPLSRQRKDILALFQGSICLPASSIPSLVRRKWSKMRYFGATLALSLVLENWGLTLAVSTDTLPTKSSLANVQWAFGFKNLDFQLSAEMCGISSLCWKASSLLQGPKHSKRHNCPRKSWPESWLCATLPQSGKHLLHQTVWWAWTCYPWPGALHPHGQPPHLEVPCTLGEKHAECALFLRLSSPGEQKMHEAPWGCRS